MKKTKLLCVLGAVAVTSSLALTFAVIPEKANAHKEPHDAETLKAFEDAFMEQVVLGDNLFHGDPAAQKQVAVIREVDEGADADVVAPSRAAEDAEDDLVEGA